MSATDSTPDRLTHLTAAGNVHMVEVGEKATTLRTAAAEGVILMAPATRALLFGNGLPKGDALAAARIAGIMALKRTAELIPLCHPVATTGARIDISEDADVGGARVRCTVRCAGQTGVEMEALTGVTVALLTLYDMLKGVQKDLKIENVRLLEKTGGRSGEYRAE